MRGTKKPGKRTPTIFKSGFADLIFTQNKIRDLRNNDDYLAAEAQRQLDGAVTLAGGTAAQQAAIRLMIATWESIANMVMSLDPIGREAIFASTPVGYMYDALEPGILTIRSIEGDPSFASMFEKLDKAYGVWISTKPASYQSDAAQGMNANFG